jgi:hypothetical protein
MLYILTLVRSCEMLKPATARINHKYMLSWKCIIYVENPHSDILLGGINVIKLQRNKPQSQVCGSHQLDRMEGTVRGALRNW